MKSPRLSFLALTLAAALPLHAQQVADRGAFIIRTGGIDTVAIDRFARVADTLTGSLTVKGTARVDYSALLGPNNTVKSLTFSQFGPNAGPDQQPLARVLITIHGDSADMTVNGATQHAKTRDGAVPSIGNSMALFEIFTRRAKAAGGTLDMPYLVAGAGSTLTVNAKPIGADSLSLTVAGQDNHIHVDAAGRILGGAIVGGPVKIEFIRVDAATAATLKIGKPDYSAPANAPYTAEEVQVKSVGGIILAGTLTIPKNASGPLPAVVTITGSGPQDRDEMLPIAGGIRMYRQIADTLSRRGVAVLRMDDRGYGASGGTFSTATSADFAEDIRAAIAYLRARKDIDPARIALIGHSEGAVIAPMVAATDPKLRGIVLMAGTADKGSDIIMRQFNTSLGNMSPAKLTPALRDSLTRVQLDTMQKMMKGPMTWTSYFMTHDPAATARKVRVPVLILQGETDTQVPPDQATKLEAAFRAGGNTSVTRKMIPATNHLFVDDPDGNFGHYDKLKNNKLAPDVLGALTDWLAQVLGAKPAAM